MEAIRKIHILVREKGQDSLRLITRHRLLDIAEKACSGAYTHIDSARDVLWYNSVESESKLSDFTVTFKCEDDNDLQEWGRILEFLGVDSR